MERKEFIERNLPEMLKDLGDLIKIPSECDMSTARSGAPLGEGNAQAIQAMMMKAKSLGMEAVNYGGYAVDITLGHGPHMIGFLAHLDVIPPGEGWDTPPYQLTVKDGKLYGRGVSDDKSPIISCLYAMKYIQENHLLPDNASIRLILGTDEETEWRCMEHYVKYADRFPDCTMVVDGTFPVVNCEKGLVDFDLSLDVEFSECYQAKINTLTGGSGRNIVPPSAVCELQMAAKEKEDILARLRSQKDLTVSSEGDICTVSTNGISTHAMQPELGSNAISKLLHGLYASGVRLREQKFVDDYERLIGLSYNGEKLGCNWSDEVSGVLTLNIGTIHYQDGHLLMEANTRYPISKSYNDIAATMFSKFEEAGFVRKDLLPLDPLYLSDDTEFIKKLMQSYRDVTGDYESKPISMGGATYARLLPDAVSFGPLFPDDPDLAHAANEVFSIDSFVKSTEIYIAALELLLKGL